MEKSINLLILVLLFCNTQLQAQNLPKSPNQIKDGKREGEWTIWMDKNWKPTSMRDSVFYYRQIKYAGGKPSGIVKDHYRNGNMQWEGYLNGDQPEDLINGKATWYREDGSVEITRVFKDNKITEEKYYNLDGTLTEERWEDLDSAGMQAYNSGEYKKALEYWQKGIIQVQKQYKNSHVSYSEAVSNLGTGYYAVGDFSKAHQFYTEYMELTAINIGKDNLIYAQALFNIGVLDLAIGNYEEAKQMCSQALSIRELLLGKDNIDYGILITLLGIIHYRTDEYNVADSLLREAQVIYEKAVGKAHYYYLDNLNHLAVVYWARGQYEKAEPLYLEVMAGAEKLMGKDHPFYLQASNNMAALYREMGDLRKAELLFRESLPKLEQKMGKNSWDYINTANNLATVYLDLGEYEKAETYYLEVLRSIEERSSKETSYIRYLANLARLYDFTGKFEKAEPLYKEAIKLAESSTGKNSGLYARNLSYLATNYSRCMRYSSAIPLFEEAIRIWEQAIGTGNPSYNEIVAEYALALWHLGDSAKVISLLNGLNDILIHQINSYFPGLSDKEKTIFYQEKIRKHVELFNYVGTQTHLENPSITGQMFDVQLSTKALLLNSNAKWKQRIRTSGDKKLFSLYISWEDKQYAIAKLYMETDSLKQKALDSLLTQTNSLEKELSRRSELFAQLADKKRYNWKDVQKQLKQDEAAIEMIRLRKYGVEKIVTDISNPALPDYSKYGFNDTVYYAALIVTPSSKYPALVLLNNGSYLEKGGLIYYRNCIGTFVTDNKSYDLFWKPIANELGKGIKKIYFSPDGVYNSISLNTLFNPKSKNYLIEETDLQLVTTTKDLLTDNKEENSNTLAMLYGYPDYQISQEKRAALVEKERTSQPVYYALNIERGTYLSDLPGTKTEVEHIAALLSARNWQPEVLMGDKALEETLKDSFKPRVLHIATHGYFQPDSLMSANKNPLLQSGLMLAGAGSSFDGDKNEKTEDGILTAYEAMNLNLDNTDLVVLSACETGLGEIRNGEGVYGLQRAFKVAGARSIIMSLWKVSDEPTQELLTAFYKYWLESGNKGKAFKRAQLDIRVKYPSPFYWGAFVMIGEY